MLNSCFSKGFSFLKMEDLSAPVILMLQESFTRIQEQCYVFKRELLISGILLNQLDIENEYQAEKVDTVKLRGKESVIELYSLVQF